MRYIIFIIVVMGLMIIAAYNHGYEIGYHDIEAIRCIP